MTDMRLAKSNLIMSLRAGVLICMLCFGGCSESVSSGPNMDPVPDYSDDKFQKQANRPPTAKTLYAMANIVAAQGRDLECESVLKRIVQEHPKFIPAYNSLAELQMRQGHTDAAIETIRAGLRIDSDDPILLNNLGMCRIVRGDYEDALEMFIEAAGIMPENAKYRANIAVALGLMGRDEEALALFKQVLPEDQASHNVSVLREAKDAKEPVPAAPSETPDSQETTR